MNKAHIDTIINGFGDTEHVVITLPLVDGHETPISLHLPPVVLRPLRDVLDEWLNDPEPMPVVNNVHTGDAGLIAELRRTVDHERALNAQLLAVLTEPKVRVNVTGPTNTEESRA
jgi:hypothetical protein